MWNGCCDIYRAHIVRTCIKQEKVQEDEEGEDVQEECVFGLVSKNNNMHL